MDESQWHWTEGGRQAGQGTLDELASLVSTGRVGADEQAWSDGMPTWAPVRDVPVLSKHLRPATAAGPVPVAVATTDPSGRIGYYSTSGNLPPRAAAVLRGHARPTGDVGDWPLDDGRVARLVEAARLRKRITDAAKLFRALFALTLIGFVGVLTGAIAVASTARGGSNAATAGLLGATAVIGAFAALYIIAARATQRSQRWAPITMLVLFLLGIVLNMAGIAVASMQRNTAPVVVGNFVGILLTAAFAFTAGKAMTAIPQYLRQPAWCQEVLARVEKRK
jgi:hypothetical protein